jgi:hypothetical protein
MLSLSPVVPRWIQPFSLFNKHRKNSLYLSVYWRHFYCLTGAFVHELFDWSRSLGLTTTPIVTDFVVSLSATSFSSSSL